MMGQELQPPHPEHRPEPPRELAPRGLARLVLLIVALTLGVHAGFEFVERTWLTDADAADRHTLHLVRGIGNALIVAALVVRRLLRSSTPAAAAGLVDRDGAAAYRTADRVGFYARWLVQLRWIAILFGASLAIISVACGEWLPPETLAPLLVTLGAMGLFNLLMLLAVHRPVARRLLPIQPLVDLLGLTVLLHFAGGIENPLHIFALFPVVIAGVVASRRQCFGVAAVATALTALLGWGEWAGVLPHYTLALVPHGEHGDFHIGLQASYVIWVTLVCTAVLFVTAHFVTQLSGRLRDDEHRLHTLAAELSAKHRLLEQALATTSIGVRVLDGERRALWSNDLWRAWFGDGDCNGCIGAVPGAVREDGESTVEVPLDTQPVAGSQRLIRVTTAAIRDERGFVREIAQLARDVTHESQEQRRLLRASQLAAVGELASHVAHEVNNPIAIMSAKARLCLSRYAASLPAKVAEDLRKIAELGDRVARIAQGLLSYARPAHGARRSLDVRDPLRRALELVQERARSTGVLLHAELTATLPPVVGNESELGQVYVNLLLNALDATPGGGRVTVLARPAPGGEGQPGIAVTVVDTGAGVSAAIADRLFEPFFTTKGAGKGTGLGLSICYGLVQSHGGTIGFTTEPGQGTCFTVWLPVGAAEEQG